MEEGYGGREVAMEGRSGYGRSAVMGGGTEEVSRRVWVWAGGVERGGSMGGGGVLWRRVGGALWCVGRWFGVLRRFWEEDWVFLVCFRRLGWVWEEGERESVDMAQEGGVAGREEEVLREVRSMEERERGVFVCG